MRTVAMLFGQSRNQLQMEHCYLQEMPEKEAKEMNTWIDETWPDGILIGVSDNPKSIVKEVLSKFRDEVERRAKLNNMDILYAVQNDKAMQDIFKEIGL